MEQQAAAGLPPPGPWQEQTATALLIVCCWQSSGTQRGFWRGAWCFGKQPLPPASRQGSFNKWVSSPENSSSCHGVHVAVVTRQGVHPVFFIYCGTSPALGIGCHSPQWKGLCLTEQLDTAKAVASSCVWETEAQLCCHTDTRIMGVKHTSSYGISSC